MQQKKALYLGLGLVAVLAIVMVLFYKFKEKGAANNAFNGGKASTSAEEVLSPFEGVYSPDAMVEALEKRVSYFSVNKREDILGASLKLDSIGSNDQTDFVECATIKLEEPVFFLRCEVPDMGTVSFDGKVVRDGSAPSFAVEGKLLWQMNSQILVEKSLRLTHMQE